MSSDDRQRGPAGEVDYAAIDPPPRRVDACAVTLTPATGLAPRTFPRRCARAGRSRARSPGRSPRAQPTPVFSLAFEAMTHDRSPSMLSGIFGLALAACVALPVDPHSGKSILDALLEAISRDWLNALFLALLLLPPYLIGLGVGVATFTGGRIGPTFVKVPLVLLSLESVLLALMIVHDAGKVRAPYALLGFTIVMALRLLSRAAQSRKRGTHVNIGWLARSGGVLVAGTFGWFRLQVGSEPIGIAITATILTAALMAVTARAGEQSPTA